MIKFEHFKSYNWMDAIRGARNSWESHKKSDSFEFISENDNKIQVSMGENDLKLLKNLVKAGSDHAKFMRQILVSVDIEAPFYWWKQADQYKVGTVTNAESTMHTLSKKEITKELFSFDEDVLDNPYMSEVIAEHLGNLEYIRQLFLETKDKKYWRALIQLLPDGFMQKRTITMNYQVLRSMYHSRKHHKLSEWHEFCTWCETLPYSELITYTGKEKKGV